MSYADNFTVHGPYKKQNSRQIVIVIDRKGKRRTVSYPKWILECQLGRKLDPDKETVDHWNGDINDNSLDNLRIVPRDQHSADDTKRVKLIKLKCAWCDKDFERSPRLLRDKAKKGKVGPFCSRECAGRYSRMLQLKLIDKFDVQPAMESEYYKRKYASFIPLDLFTDFLCDIWEEDSLNKKAYNHIEQNCLVETLRLVKENPKLKIINKLGAEIDPKDTEYTKLDPDFSLKNDIDEDSKYNFDPESEYTLLHPDNYLEKIKNQSYAHYIAIMNLEEIHPLAIGSYYELLPTAKQLANKIGSKYIEYYNDDDIPPYWAISVIPISRIDSPYEFYSEIEYIKIEKSPYGPCISYNKTYYPPNNINTNFKIGQEVILGPYSSTFVMIVDKQLQNVEKWYRNENLEIFDYISKKSLEEQEFEY